MLMGVAACVNAENGSDDGWCECCSHSPECTQDVFDDENGADQGAPAVDQAQPQVAEDDKNTVDNSVALPDNRGVEAENASEGENK